VAWIDLPGGVSLDKLLTGFSVCVLTWTLILLLHAYQHRRNGFGVLSWIREKKATFAVGLSVTLIIALLRAFTKDMAQLLTYMGFQPGPSAAISIGMAIAALLLGFKPPSKKKENDENNES